MLPRIRAACQVFRRDGLREAIAQTLAWAARVTREGLPPQHPPPDIPYVESSYYAEVRRVPPIRLIADTGQGERLNVVVPHFSEAGAFGGIVSALEVARDISVHYDSVRFVASDAPLGPDVYDLTRLVATPQGKTVEAVSLRKTTELVCHPHEVFFCTIWWTVALWDAYTLEVERAGFQPNPFYYFIQDFEPGFYPRGYRYAASLETYGRGDAIHAIVNSAELARSFAEAGYRFGKTYVLRPSLHPAIQRYLAAREYSLPPKPTSPLTILVYGRPREPRNCFASIVEGLYRFFAALPAGEHSRFAVISAGQPHKDLRLFPEVVVRSVGKVPVEDYVTLLEQAHVGIALMASPHPSYPPLEMATFGLQTITNRFENKDLASAHPLIHAIDAPLPAYVATALGEAVAAAQGQQGQPVRAVLPSNVSPLPWAENVAQLGIEPIRSRNR